ncbi:MAG TPA: carboxypeptidase regulatory-like domain-containing protein [Pyrinomonadaceae bacterium]|jgi:hypothetical protein
MHIRINSHLRLFSAAILLLACLSQAVIFVSAQTETTGAFRGRVVDESGAGLPEATVRAVNKLTGVPTATKTTPDGYFTIGLLQPGDYTLIVQKGDMYDVRTRDQRLTAVDATTVLPEPFMLKRRTAGAIAATSPTPTTTGTPDATAQATPDATAQASPVPSGDESADVAIDINKRNPRRGGIFTREEVSTLPLGATTLTRSFDELALLLPGVATPPQTLGSIAGPGVGPGVGSAGQFAVNGMRSRSNNFTVDGSDNNDEDIGVRRQGFLALVPQPIESIQEYQVTTLLAPAQYGRNLGAQVNAVSKSGGNDLHGSFYGFLNSSQLNARNPFDTANGTAVSGLFAGNQPVVQNCPAPCTSAAAIAQSQIRIQNFSGGKDSFTLGQGGMVLGGKLVPDRLFYFISAEGQALNASKEASFAVPTVQQRGAFGSGASGIFLDPFSGSGAFAFPTTVDADAIFSLFPFPNNPNGIYGANTFTRVLPASGQGKILSGKVDGNWKWNGRQQSFTARYNFTDDYRDIPVTGEALFSTLRPRVRTQNFSTFLNSQISGLESSRPVFNQLRASYGRTRLNFQEYLDPGFQLRSDEFPSQPFLLNAPLRINNTLPNFVGFNPITGAIISTPNTGPVRYGAGGTAEQLLGPIGQVKIAGFSPVGVDVFNFPQRRVNNTYQVADTMTVRLGNHNLAFGTDIRRTELNSDLPRLARPLVTFNGAPRLIADFDAQGNPSNFRFSGFLNPLDLAAASAASGFFQTLSSGASAINLRYYQYNFFVQDEWRVTENFVLSYGLRYEYNTPPRETSRRIESTFNSPSIAKLVPGLSNFINGRTGIFDPDKNNFAPRVGFAYSPQIFGPNHTTVLRAGYGMYYDQILGAVVSQSRNVFPTAATINFAGGLGALFGGEFDLFNPQFLARTGTLNEIDPALPIADIIDFLKFFGGVNAFGVTLPERTLKTPMAHQYGVTLEQQLGRSLVISAAYVGTQGRNLLRLTTPNLGPNAILLPLSSSTALDPFGGNFTPGFSGIVLAPGTNITPAGFIVGGRPVNAAGPVEIYRSNSRSRYDALQLQMRGRFGFLGSSSQFQAQYTFSKSRDDASDVFDLAGSPALPQDSLTQAGEYAPSNFDVRHRFSYNYISDLSDWGRGNAFLHFLFNGTQVAGTGIFQTGQPFTVNSIFDVNLDGNLTDRPNTTTGIQATGNRARPYILTVNNPTSLLAPVGQNGAVPRNAFRGSNLWLTNSSIIKNFRISEDKSLSFRMDVFNLFNRANYGIPVRYLETPWFGRATDTVTPGRRIQFGIKYTF